jgi:hypothetical protein
MAPSKLVCSVCFKQYVVPSLAESCCWDWKYDEEEEEEE